MGNTEEKYVAISRIFPENKEFSLAERLTPIFDRIEILDEMPRMDRISSIPFVFKCNNITEAKEFVKFIIGARIYNDIPIKENRTYLNIRGNSGNRFYIILRRSFWYDDDPDKQTPNEDVVILLSHDEAVSRGWVDVYGNLTKLNDKGNYGSIPAILFGFKTEVSALKMLDAIDTNMTTPYKVKYI